jgi:23S rRNA pseudouridine1911/1915/1917 synthase
MTPSEPPAAARRFTIAASDAGRRLDQYLASQLPELSRTRIQELIDEGHARVSGRSPRRAHRLTAGEIIEIEVLPRPPLAAQPEEIPIELLYEDADFVVVNKPAGMVVHVGAGARSGTLVNALLHRLKTLSTEGGTLRPGIVHRLDRGTSGALVVARNDAAHRALAAQFRARTVQKTYIALLHGRLPRDSGVINLPIARDPKRRTRMTARLRSGREASTGWRVLLRLEKFTLVAADLHTGRTHQIRAHLAHLGAPLIGDPLYGKQRAFKAEGPYAEEAAAAVAAFPRQALHAAVLGFKHPVTGEELRFESALPADMQALLAVLRKL